MNNKTHSDMPKPLLDYIGNGKFRMTEDFRMDDTTLTHWLFQDTGETYPLSAVKIEIPIIPRTFYAAGFNYAIHVAEIAKAMGEKPNLPTSADIGYRANNALIAHDEDVIIPADATEQVQYEGEIVYVIGKKVKNVSPEQALDCVFGYTIGNDVSERSWQKTDRTFFRCKNTDTFNYQRCLINIYSSCQP